MHINAERIDSSSSLVGDRANSSMNVFDKRNVEKMRRNNKKGKRHRKRYDVLEVSISLKQMVNVGMDLVSIARSHHNGGMPVGECVDELLSSGHVEESNQLNLFVLWSL